MNRLPSFSRVACALLLAAFVTACSSSSSLPSGHTPGAPVPSGKKVKATIRITIPKHKRHRRIKRHGHYVSVNTKSMRIVITPGGQTFNIGLDASNTQTCPAVAMGAPLVCTATIFLAPGSYTGAFSAYDGPVVSGNVTGDVLSANQTVPMTILAAKANQINLTLDGIPAQVVFIPDASSSLTGDAMIGYTGTKCGNAAATSTGMTESVYVFGKDAMNNAIVGPGAPVPSLTLPNSPPAGWAIATPDPNSSAAPNTFVISHPVSTAAQGPVTLTAAATPLDGSGGAPATLPVDVSISGGTSLCGFIKEFAIPTAGSFPWGITGGPDGNLWFTESGPGGSGAIAKITTDGAITEYAIPACGPGQQPIGIAAGPDGNIWFTSLNCNYIAKSTTMGSITTYGIAWTSSYPSSITAGPDGNMWVVAGAGYIVKSTTNGSQSKYSSGLSQSPNVITAGADGNLWFSEVSGTKVGQITTGGTITEPATITNCGFYGCGGITVGPDGNLWIAEFSNANIGRITTGGVVTEFPGAGGDPYSITAGPDSAMWYTNCSGNVIGRITTDGMVQSTYPVPTNQSNPKNIVAGPDGALWFTEYTGNNIGRLQ